MKTAFYITLSMLIGAVCGSLADAVEGPAFSWGANDLGQLGNGKNATLMAPTIMSNKRGQRWRKVEIMGEFGISQSICGIDWDYNLYYWARNDQLGTIEPTLFGTLTDKWADIATGCEYGILDTGEISHIQSLSESKHVLLNKIPGKFTNITVGYATGCAIKADDDELYCFDSWSQLRAMHRIGQVNNTKYKSVSSGWSDLLAVTTDGQLHVWSNGDDAIKKQPPQIIMPERKFDEVKAGWWWDMAIESGTRNVYHVYDGLIGSENDSWSMVTTGRDSMRACAIHQDTREMQCFDSDPPYLKGMKLSYIAEEASWGDFVCGIEYKSNYLYCQGTMMAEEIQIAPKPVSYNTTFTQVSAGYGVSCAIDAQGHLWWWGMGYQVVPKLIKSKKTWSACYALSMDYIPWYTLDSDGYLYSWYLVELENNYSEKYITKLSEKVTEKAFSVVSMHSSQFCGIERQTQNLYCAGSNKRGQLGNNSTVEESSVPVLVGTESDKWLDVAVGPRHACAIDSNRRLWCFGDNRSSQLGLGKGPEVPKMSLIPVSPKSDSNFKSVSASDVYTCAITTKGEVLCFGRSVPGSGVQKLKQPTVVFGRGMGSMQHIDTNYEILCGIQSDTNNLYCLQAYQSLLLLGAPDVYPLPYKAKLIGSKADQWDCISLGYNHALLIKNPETTTRR